MIRSDQKKRKSGEFMDVIYKTKDGVEIGTIRGRKGPHDFRVKFKEPNKRERTPAHVHLVIELYVKYAHDPKLTLEMRDHLLSVFDSITPINYYPPKLQVFKPEHINKFRKLDEVGEFTSEFMLVATELIMIQEKTNYPEGSQTQKLYRAFGVKDRFSVIQKAIWRG